MDLDFQRVLGEGIKGPTQKAKALTEHWFGQQGYCPACGNREVRQFRANRPVADFYCPHCLEEFELKSLRVAPGPRIGDGAFRTMMERLNSSANPSLILLHYDPVGLSVRNLLLIPKFFFTPEIIEERKPLSATARRAGWIGCKIVLKGIPETGRISLVKNDIVVPQEQVIAAWRKTQFLQSQGNLNARGWLLSVMQCIERLDPVLFTLEQCYGFERELRAKYPLNMHIRPKIRQQLRVLRDNGFIDFLGGGKYRLASRA